MFLCARNFISLVRAYVVWFLQVYVMLPIMCCVSWFVLKNDYVFLILSCGSSTNCFVILTNWDLHSGISLADNITFKQNIF